MTEAFVDYTLRRIQHEKEGEKRLLLHRIERELLDHPLLEEDPRLVIASVIERHRDALATPQRVERGR